MIKEKITLRIQNFFDWHMGDQLIIALEPVIVLMPYEAGIMPAFDCAVVVDNGKKLIPKKNG